MKTPDYLSYERYKKRKETNPNKRIFIFVVTFFITLLGFSVIVKALSPDVDVNIGGDTEMEPKDTGLGVKRFIDERLKLIQMDDNSAGVSTRKGQEEASGYGQKQKDTYDYDISEENMKLPSKNKQKYSQDEEEPVMPAYSQSSPPRPMAKEPAAQNDAPRISKVYVGRYSTIDQARVAQEILMDSGVGVTPFIKEIGGSYTLQIGSYSSRAKAEELSSELRRNGFPARIQD